MVASSVTVWAPPDNGNLPNNVVRPGITVAWTGGVGPFNVRYTWDDDPTFANGNGRRQVVTNTSVTSPDDGYPTADLALLTAGTTWYVKADVIDTGDSNAELSDTDNDFTYLDPNDQNRYRYLLANVGFGFDDQDTPSGGWGTSIGGTAGPDGQNNPSLLNQYRYLLANVGVGFHAYDEPGTGWGTSIGGTEGIDGNWKTTNRYLYLLGSVGVGFDPIDRPALGWNGNTGLTSQGPPDGYAIDFPRFLYQLANVDTTQPCPFVFSLSTNQIQQGQSVIVYGQGLVSDTSPTADAWGAQVRIYETPSFAASYTTLTITGWTAGATQDTIQVTVPGGTASGYVAVVHGTTPTCDGSNFIFLTVQAVAPDVEAGWWVEVWELRNDTAVIRPLADVTEADFEHVANDIGRGSITVPGAHPDIGSIIDRAANPPVQKLIKVYLHDRFAYAFVPQDLAEAYDEDGARRVRIYGEGQEGILRWGRCLWQLYPNPWLYGSGDNLLPWGNIEPSNALTNGGLEDAQPTPWAPIATATLFATTSEARTGQYSLEVTPAALNDGTLNEFSVQAGQRIYVDVYLKDPAGGGNTLTIRVQDDAPSVVASTTLGVTAAWQKVTLTWVAASDYTATLEVLLTAGTVRPFLLDDADAYTNVGAPTGDLTTARATARLSRTYVAGGLHSMEVACNAGGDTTFNGLVAFFPVTENQTATFTFAVTGPVGTDADFALRMGGNLDIVNHTFTGLGTWDAITLTGTAGADEDTARFAMSSKESGALTFYVDEMNIQPGAPAATAGAILGDVLAAAQARNTLPFVTATFTDTLDSTGATWPETLNLEISPEWTIWDLCEKLIGLGYDAELVPANWRAGGDAGWRLNVYNPLGAGTDWSTSSDGPAILPSPTVADAQPSAAPPATTVVYGEGDGFTSNTSSSAAVINALERREDFVRNKATQDANTLFRSLTHRLDIANTRGARFTADLTDDGQPLPYLDFRPYDRLRASLPTDGARVQVADDVYRVAAITARLTSAGRGQHYEVDFGRYQLHAARLRDLLLQRLLARDTTELWQPGTGSIRQQ